MPLHRLSDAELRAACKATIESLEVWLRRLIDLLLCSEFGNDYINALNPATGDHLFKKRMRDSIQRRVDREPNRYARCIDAALLEDVIYIVCHSSLYDRFFEPFFVSHYPHGRNELKTFLERLIGPRNALAHSNPLSVRQAEQVICYSHDAIDAIKCRMEEINMDKDYNAPTIIKITDSRGFVFHDSEISRFGDGLGQVNLIRDRSAWLTVGDILRVEVEIDPSFSPKDYRIRWEYPNRCVEHTESSLILNISHHHVRASFHVICKVVSNKTWHRCGDVDDHVTLMYRVLPGEL